jgi:xylulokinase
MNTDSRAIHEAAWCEQQIGRKQIFSITGHTSHAMYPVPKLLWLRKNAPEVFAAARHFLGVTDYLLFRLGLSPLVDYSHASRFMAFDVHALGWSQDMLSIAGVSPSTLATPVPTGTIAGKLGSVAASMLGIPEGTPVVVGGHDQVIGALGMGVVNGGRAAGSLGTYECVLVVSDLLQLNQAALDSSLNAFPHAVPGKFVTIAYFPSGIMLQWLHSILFESQSAEDYGTYWKMLESEAPEGPTGLLVTPHLIGSCNPEFDSHAKAVIYGLTLGSTRSHLYKGIIEGIASELTLISRHLESAGSTFHHINVSGGGVRSSLGLRLRAAFTGKQLHIMSCQESACLGGAILASVAMGVYPDLESAARAMVHEQESILVDPLLAQQYSAQLASYLEFRSMLVHPSPNTLLQEVK